MDESRETGTVKVSFLYIPDEKGGKATRVQIEEAAAEDSSPREMGIVKRWNAEKGFGFIGRGEGLDDAFVGRWDCGGKDLPVGQHVSFVFEEGPKGASAKSVKEEEGVETAAEEVEGERELGKVKTYNEEKGFAFIGRCAGGDDLFAHKKEFGSLDPYPGMPVSFVVESTDKGDAAKKVREEESVPELPISDAGREFGNIKVSLGGVQRLHSEHLRLTSLQDFNQEKGFGFIIRKSGGDNARFFDKACNGLIPTKGLLVSYVCEEGEKGPTAKDLREEDPIRVARVTAKVHYGRVESYWDPTEKKPTNGYGFIIPFDKPSYGAPNKYFFHMDEIEDPDEDGGIEPGTNVSFIVIAAKKGVQAAAVTIADRPVEENGAHDDKENMPALEKSFADTGFGNDNGFDNDPFGIENKAEQDNHAAPSAAPAAIAVDDAAWDF
ncbi:cold shock protein, partial [Lecanoromycetidae sp. Uapishka_2]